MKHQLISVFSSLLMSTLLTKGLAQTIDIFKPPSSEQASSPSKKKTGSIADRTSTFVLTKAPTHVYPLHFVEPRTAAPLTSPPTKKPTVKPPAPSPKKNDEPVVETIPNFTTTIDDDEHESVSTNITIDEAKAGKFSLRKSNSTSSTSKMSTNTTAKSSGTKPIASSDSTTASSTTLTTKASSANGTSTTDAPTKDPHSSSSSSDETETASTVADDDDGASDDSSTEVATESPTSDPYYHDDYLSTISTPPPQPLIREQKQSKTWPTIVGGIFVTGALLSFGVTAFKTLQKRKGYEEVPRTMDV